LKVGRRSGNLKLPLNTLSWRFPNLKYAQEGPS
jgi:hypothetical protein